MDLSPELRVGSSHLSKALYWHDLNSSDHGGTPTGAILEGDWKLIEFFEDGHLELYNLKEDPGERHNQASVFGDRAAKMHAKLADWRKSVGALMRIPNPKNNTVLDGVHSGPIGWSVSPNLKPAASKIDVVGDPEITDPLAITPFVVSSLLS